jgi:hypothetical protein
MGGCTGRCYVGSAGSGVLEWVYGREWVWVYVWPTHRDLASELEAARRSDAVNEVVVLRRVPAELTRRARPVVEAVEAGVVGAGGRWA